MRYIGGIDPGLTGALCVLDFSTYLLHLWDTPTVSVKMAGGNLRKRCDPAAFRQVLTTFPLDEATIENVHSTPNDGHVGAFSFGKVTGITIGLIHGLDIPLHHVTPAKWKKDMQVPAHKEAAKARASVLFPLCVDGWKRALDHGRAEASIIALYGAITSGLAPRRRFALATINGVAI